MDIKSKLKMFLKMPFQNKLNSIHSLWRRFLGVIYYRRIFGSFGSGSILYSPLLISNPQYIHIGKNVLIRQGARLEVLVIDPNNPPELRIGDNVTIEQDAHIVCLGKITMHDGSGLAPRCTLLCAGHPFFDVKSMQIINQRLEGVGATIEIGQLTVVGVNSVVQMNVSIGRHVMVGANSVVKRSVPDYSVVAGNPATVVMRYDETKERWVPMAR